MDPNTPTAARFPARAWLIPLLLAIAATGVFLFRPPARRLAMGVAIVTEPGRSFTAGDAPAQRRMPAGSRFRVLLSPGAETFAAVYLIGPTLRANELWPPDGQWPRLEPGKPNAVPGDLDWFDCGARPGPATLLVAWSDRPLRARASVWTAITRSLETGGGPRRDKIEHIRRLLADVSSGVAVIELTLESPPGAK